LCALVATNKGLDMKYDFISLPHVWF